MNPTRPICKSCLHFRPNRREDGTGLCTVHPPEWPKVHEYQWCGQHACPIEEQPVPDDNDDEADAKPPDPAPTLTMLRQFEANMKELNEAWAKQNSLTNEIAALHSQLEAQRKANDRLTISEGRYRKILANAYQRCRELHKKCRSKEAAAVLISVTKALNSEA